MKQDTRMIQQQKRGKRIRTISAKHYRGKERHTIIPDDITRNAYKTRNTVWLPKESGATGLIIRRWRQSVNCRCMVYQPIQQALHNNSNRCDANFFRSFNFGASLQPIPL